jgi:hypothetical protein
MKKSLNIIAFLLMTIVLAFVFTISLSVAPIIGLAIALGFSIIAGAFKSPNNVAMAGLYKEVWVAKIMEKFYPNSSHFLRSVDMTSFVENDTINLADAGVDPDVLINNNTYPIPFAERVDNPLPIPLDHFVTEGTVVRNPELVVISYDKMASVVRGHQNALRSGSIQRGTHAWAPQAEDAWNPVFPCTGANRGDGLKALTSKDIAKAERICNELDLPMEGRILVLSPKHKEDLQNESTALFNQFANLKTGEFTNLFGFEIYVSSMVPRYNRTNGQKVAFKAAVLNTDSHASIFYHEFEVMRADGSLKVNFEERNVSELGTLMNADKRFIGLPIRNKFRGAIYTPNA